MDHIGVQARAESAKLILKRVEKNFRKKLPAILTGDFNVDQHSKTYLLLEISGIMPGFLSDSGFPVCTQRHV